MTGNQLKALRLKAGYSRPKLADKAGCHKDTIKNYEHLGDTEIFSKAGILGRLLNILTPKVADTWSQTPNDERS